MVEMRPLPQSLILHALLMLQALWGRSRYTSSSEFALGRSIHAAAMALGVTPNLGARGQWVL